ncbi:MAG: M81 family metallopeptidase [Thermoflexales bacterium]
MFKIALGAIFTECNELGGLPIDLSWFERFDLKRGDEILEMRHGAVGGMLQVVGERRSSAVPLVYASTCPGGYITADCYAQLKSELLERLSAAMPVDGVLLPLHGAAVAEGFGDVEGDLISAVRRIVGPAVPIVATLDCHAHVTREMVHGADGLIAWETYPHRDAFSTGQRGARLLLDTLEGRCRPVMVMARVPVITSAIHGSTDGDDPFAVIMRRAKALEGHDGVLSTSIFLVQPFLDQPEMGSGALVITDCNRAQAEALALDLAHEYWTRRFDFEGDIVAPAEAIRRGLQVEGGPVILVETADCSGGGAAGDSIATLAALLAAETGESALIPVVDPAAAAACQRAGLGNVMSLSVGHSLDPHWGKPITITGKIGHLSDGRFTYTGGVWDGLEGKMGPTAVLEIGPMRLMITSYATYDWMDEQFQSVGLDASATKFVVAKNPMNYRQAYGAIAKAIFVLDTPGPTPPTVRHAPFQRVRRPYFPRDLDIPGLVPTILARDAA